MNKLKSFAASKRGRDTLLSFGIVIAAFIIVQALIAGGMLSSQIKGLLVPICAYVVMAVSLNLTVGILGELSLGHAGFMSVGAFAGIVTTTCLADVIPLAPLRLAVAVIVGAVFAAIAGVIVGVPVLRLKGDYLAIVTLAFGEIIKNIVNVMYLGFDESGLHFSLVEQKFQLSDTGTMIINGPIGVSGVTKISTFTSGVVLILVTLFFVLNFINSRTGRAVMAVRDNKIAADSIGISVTRYKLLAFVVSAAFAGAAGTLYAMNFSTVTAAKFDFNTSILVLVFVVLGGLGNIWGSIIAAALLTLLPELLRGLSNYRMLIYAVLLIAMMLFNNSSLKKRMLEKRGMKQMEKLEKTAKSGKEGA
ncbi:MAG: branched-chain amino acid ABC transporter permease [Butyricicoccus sp.]|nr:branched-chain amino acid ABC transporter permease [uncultured Agathobaculum sp.]MBD9068888.1 branched-chain amino acid ABC transporter permease [Butyricicoccus sp.]